MTVVQTEYTAPLPPEPVKEKKPVSERLYVPIKKKLTTADAIVQAAKKWNKYSAAVVRKLPHVAVAVTNRQITIDGEGIILLFDRNEGMSKNIAHSFIKAIQSEYSKAAGIDIVMKAAFADEIEDYIIDLYAIPDAEVPQSESIEAADAPKDPIDVLAQKFPDIVEFTDDSEFINYKETDFSQSALTDKISDDEDDDSEEFLEENEIKKDDN